MLDRDTLIDFDNQVYKKQPSLIFYTSKIRVPKVPFRVFEKLKNEIQNFILRFYFYLIMKNEIQITDFHFHDFFFEFEIPSFVFIFIKKWETNYSLFFVICFH